MPGRRARFRAVLNAGQHLCRGEQHEKGVWRSDRFSSRMTGERGVHQATIAIAAEATVSVKQIIVITIIVIIIIIIIRTITIQKRGSICLPHQHIDSCCVLLGEPVSDDGGAVCVLSPSPWVACLLAALAPVGRRALTAVGEQRRHAQPNPVHKALHPEPPPQH
ncbi:hypothetical protein GGTG_01239 [Gaeumannomyces tritici R3-111a-1]|uniref:Uncharacterized protein n=1 Tax=Gaeumannomyces tritici (strain R3-111a-1) TaxID=644352 RepID=J3NJ05_GAET3|nr:hypothetical protein GGTG_01239 [Gaeumannomyces tritici R3-111a-1]EJT81255.1 hypothetical protein GGTG_01239 [Gaeumannomyces tritici R3-111a-1]